jgi:endonuclease V-like protein UPF0215 family
VSLKLAHVVGFDDAPFTPSYRGDVLVVGAVFAGPCLTGILTTRVERDGADATRRLADRLTGSRFFPQLQAVLLQGIAFAGFNVVDIRGLHARTGLPVLVVVRRLPDLAAIRAALLAKVPGGAEKWRLIEVAGPVEPMAGVFVQRAGLSLSEAEALLGRFRLWGKLPEPLRVAHLIAGGVTLGESRHRA